MNKKNYLLADGKIRNCTSNHAKMTWYEYGWYFGFKTIKYSIKATFCDIPRIISEFFMILVFLVMLLFLPIIAPILFVNCVRKARKEVEEENLRKEARNAKPKVEE